MNLAPRNELFSLLAFFSFYFNFYLFNPLSGEQHRNSILEVVGDESLKCKRGRRGYKQVTSSPKASRSKVHDIVVGVRQSHSRRQMSLARGSQGRWRCRRALFTSFSFSVKFRTQLVNVCWTSFVVKVCEMDCWCSWPESTSDIHNHPNSEKNNHKNFFWLMIMNENMFSCWLRLVWGSELFNIFISLYVTQRFTRFQLKNTNVFIHRSPRLMLATLKHTVRALIYSISS